MKFMRELRAEKAPERLPSTQNLEVLIDDFTPEPKQVELSLNDKEKVALKDLLGNVLSYYLYAPDAFNYIGSKPLREFGINSDEKVKDVFFASGIWKRWENPYLRLKVSKEIQEKKLPARVSNEIVWEGDNREQYIEWINEFVDKYNFIPPVRYVGKNPELKVIINDNPWGDSDVKKLIEGMGYKVNVSKEGIDINNLNYEEFEDFLADFAEKFSRYPKVRYDGNDIKLVIFSHLVNGEDPWDDKRVREYFSRFGEVEDYGLKFVGDKKLLRAYAKASSNAGWNPNTKLESGLTLKGSFINGKNIPEGELPDLYGKKKRRRRSIIAIPLTIGSLIAAAGYSMVSHPSDHNGYTVSELTKNWNNADNATLMEAWAKYIFHFPNAPSTDLMNGNLSWLSSGERAFLNYTFGNFTVNGESLMTNKTVFDTLFYMVNNASENINGRMLARMMAGNEFIQGGTASDYLFNTLPGWGLLDPIELKAAVDIANHIPKFKEYGNLTLALGELNATHNGFTPQVDQFLNGVLSVLENRTWMERRFLENYYMLTNKSFQWDGGSHVGYLAWPVNDSADFLYLLWNNDTVRSVLGWDQNANATILLEAGIFGQYLDKGRNGFWPDERVMKLAVQYIQEMGSIIKNSISIKNSIIAERRVPWVGGSSVIEQHRGETSFKDSFIENTTMQGDSPYTFAINGTRYLITDPIKYFYDKFWGPNAVYNLRQLVEGKTIPRAYGNIHSWILDTMDNNTNPGEVPGNVTNLLNYTMILLLDNDGNPNNDIKVGVSCGLQADLTDFLFKISPEYVNGTGIVNPNNGVPLSGMVSLTNIDEQNYVPWVNKHGTPIITIGGYDGNVSIDPNQSWYVPQERIRFFGPDEKSSVIAWLSPLEGYGPDWPDIPPGEPLSHYYANTTYTKSMLRGAFSVYGIHYFVKNWYFKSLYEKYDLFNLNVTADQRSTHYPSFESSVPEFDPLIGALGIIGVIPIIYRKNQLIKTGHR